ncbi:PIG-L family deacetylase [Clostridium sp. CCUG 7971]|uniref:PIG-L deacetylase family protein n=1 Tax=Clostridium sp. CCUG 7971 TaxID=2811414 RepID=UPI001ABA2364|nr:PIG-L family deacetylase [Clostridium sp. CCUG 7971]MBO3445106.1 PIG-L family deacetylase [Clostridium sp. CCUG 7971]
MNGKIFKICIGVLLILIIGFVSWKKNSNNSVLKHEANYDRKFSKNVVFYPQHQDDEVLWGASAIARAVNEVGENNVYVVLVSDGSGVNVFKNNKKFKDLTREEKKELRNNEFRDALKQLGVKKENIKILADIDEKPGTHYELMKKTILDFEKNLGSVTHIAHHYKYDDHIMHRKNGEVLKKLSDEKKVKDALYFVKPEYRKDIPMDKKVIYEANNSEMHDKVKKACYEYREVDEKKNKFGIGYTSAHSYFDKLLSDPRLTSVLSIY